MHLDNDAQDQDEKKKLKSRNQSIGKTQIQAI